MASLNEVLVVNAGSTSLKLSMVDHEEQSRSVSTFAAAADVAAVGHRIVHGGEHVRPSVIDDSLFAELVDLVELAPLHNAPAVAAIAEARRRWPDADHVAVFDSAFHHTLPSVAATFLLPERFRARGIRRYGFHGLSVAWAATRVDAARVVVCHLGGGSSVTAVLDGVSVDTSMGFTPLDGVPMASRAGAVDPGVLIYLLRAGIDLDDLEHALEYESGLVGLAGTGDVSQIVRDSSSESRLALEIYCYRIAQSVAAMAAALNGIDALVFTAGVGEHSEHVRAAICAQLAFLGVALDADANAGASGDADITASGSRVAIRIVTAREDVMIARGVRSVLAASSRRPR